nr:restriction endonuclease subunit S [Inhella proteolytica]
MIPEDWECAPIATVARLESGHTPSKRMPSYWGGNVNWVSLHDTQSLDGPEISATSKSITEDGLNNSSARLLPQGTVVFSRTATVGKATVMASPMATSQDFANYICGPKLHNHFLVYLFRSMGRTWRGLMAGSIHNTIYMPVFEALKIALPPVAEQHAIAAALGDVDALLAGLDRLIAKKRDIKQAAMQQLLTGQARLPGFQDAWEVKPLGQLVSIQKGQLITAKTLAPGHVPVIAGGKQPAYFHAFANRFGRTITISASGASAGYVAIHEGPIFASDCSTISEADGYSLDFVYYQLLLKQALIYKAQTGGAQPHIHAKDVNPIPFFAPAVDEQAAIAEILRSMDAELAALEARRDKTRALKQGMMQELLTGRTRLV